MMCLYHHKVSLQINDMELGQQFHEPLNALVLFRLQPLRCFERPAMLAAIPYRSLNLWSTAQQQSD